MRKSTQLICHLGPFILMSALLVGCGTRGPVQQTMFDIITLSSGQAIEFAATTATFPADKLAFEGFVNDTDSVLINVEEVEAGKLSFVFLAELPFTGSFGRLVFRRLRSESGTVTVAPLQVGDDQAPVPLEVERSTQDEKPPFRRW